MQAEGDKELAVALQWPWLQCGSVQALAVLLREAACILQPSQPKALGIVLFRPGRTPNFINTVALS